MSALPFVLCTLAIRDDELVELVMGAKTGGPRSGNALPHHHYLTRNLPSETMN